MYFAWLTQLIYKSEVTHKIAQKILWTYRQWPIVRPSGIVNSAQQWIDEHRSEQSWYQRRRGSWYIEVLSEEIINFKKPNHIDEIIHKNFRREYIRYSPKASLFYFNGAYILGSEGVIISQDNKIFDEFTHEFDIRPLAKTKYFQPFKFFNFEIEPREEWIASITAPAAENYYHWLFDCLPRFKLLEKVQEYIEYLVVPYNLKQFHIDTLKILGFTEENFIRLKPNQKIYCERLFVPSLPGSEGSVPKWSIKFLQETFIKKCLIQKKPCSSLIYISREDAPERKVINEDEVKDYLKSVGFQSFVMSELSFLEQVEICFNARVVVSPHGAALSNIVFCENAKILEIFSPDWVRADCYYTLANMTGNEYWYLIGLERTEQRSFSWGDILVDVKALKRTIERMLE